MPTLSIVDLASWEKKINRDAVAERPDGEPAGDPLDQVLMEHLSDAAMEMSRPSEELYKDGILTLGCIGTLSLGQPAVKPENILSGPSTGGWVGR